MRAAGRAEPSVTVGPFAISVRETPLHAWHFADDVRRVWDRLNPIGDNQPAPRGCRSCDPNRRPGRRRRRASCSTSCGSTRDQSPRPSSSVERRGLRLAIDRSAESTPSSQLQTVALHLFRQCLLRGGLHRTFAWACRSSCRPPYRSEAASGYNAVFQGTPHDAPAAAGPPAADRLFKSCSPCRPRTPCPLCPFDRQWTTCPGPPDPTVLRAGVYLEQIGRGWPTSRT